MGINFNPSRSDVNDGGVTTAVIAVGTSAVELKVGVTRSVNRQVVSLFNDGTNTVYLGPATVTAAGATKGIPVAKGQFISIPVGDTPLFAISASGSNSVIVMELS